MQDYLILKLEGPLQAWGRESFEGTRPSEAYPGRSALLGLLGACFGFDRTDKKQQKKLADNLIFAVRIDEHDYDMQKMTDYHTVKDARVDYQGLKSHETIQTWREYWQDAKYTVVISVKDSKAITLESIKKAIQSPIYTPVLGRRSCPLARPLYEGMVTAKNGLEALGLVEPKKGTIYSDKKEDSSSVIEVKKRDVPIIDQPRQFASRIVYMTKAEGEKNVSE